jgi:hypothetical protein
MRGAKYTSSRSMGTTPFMSGVCCSSCCSREGARRRSAAETTYNLPPHDNRIDSLDMSAGTPRSSHRKKRRAAET